MVSSKIIKKIAQIVEQSDELSNEYVEEYLKEDLMYSLEARNKKFEEKFSPENKLEFLRVLLPQTKINILCAGYYQSILSNDYSHLNDALFTYNRIEFLWNKQKNLVSHSGTDASHIFYILSAFAGNDLKCIDYYFSKYSSTSTNSHRYTKSLVNLILGILKKDNVIIDSALIEAKIFLTRKNSVYTQSVIEFLIGIVEKDFEKINTSFTLAIRSYPKEKSIHQFYNPIYKYLPIQLYGLLKIAQISIGKDFLDRFKEPESEIWSPEFFTVLVKGEVGEDFIIFQNELEFLNKELHNL